MQLNLIFRKRYARRNLGSIENDEIQLVDDYVEFIKNYQGDTLVITGSLYFISEVKSKLDFEAL